MKRIGMLVSKMVFRPSSGLSIFIKGVVETLIANGHQVDIILDGEPTNDFLSEHGLNFYYPGDGNEVYDQPFVKYSEHSNLFQFKEGFNFEQSINFRTSITKALVNNVYDVFICNGLEPAFVCYQMELYKYINVSLYLHENVSVNPNGGNSAFRECYDNMIRQMQDSPIMNVTQTWKNRDKIIENIGREPKNLTSVFCPLTDSDDLGVVNQDGILYIGRYEQRKNPELYLKVLEGIREKYGVEIKARILTRKKHANKFESYFKSINYSNYEILGDVTGLEKAKLIQSSKVAFLPYKNESFGIAVLESLRYMKTFVLDEYDWHYNFTEFSNLGITTRKTMVDDIYNAHENYVMDLESVKKDFDNYIEEYEKTLDNLINIDVPIKKSEKEPKNRLYSKLSDNRGKWVNLKDYFLEENEKKIIYLKSDVESIYTTKEWIRLKQDKQITYVGLPDETGNITDYYEKENIDFF